MQILKSSYEELSVCKNKDVETLLAEDLFKAQKQVTECSEELTTNRVLDDYPILGELLK
ncbi:MAG: hypothetical protein AAFQ80_05465 [Cyanobacteria bacterium J06621_8]